MRPFRVLIVDDSPVFQQAAHSILVEEPGFEIVGLASSGSEALNLAARMAPDLILTDLSMTGMNGLELTRHLVGTSASPLVVIMTGHAQPQYRYAAKAVGVAGFVLKSELTVQLPILLQQFKEHARRDEESKPSV